MSTLQILLLGSFSVIWDEKPIVLAANSARLLAYLGLSHGRLVLRTRVAGALWPDLSEQRARANISTVAWRLRRELLAQGCLSDLLVATAESIGLNVERCDVDVHQFMCASIGPGTRVLSLDSLARAVGASELYRGDLLEDWDAEWCRLEREELRRRYLSTLQAISEGFERRSRHDLALQYAHQATKADPYNEYAQRNLMRILCLTGDTAAAVSQFNRFQALVRDELGIEPDGETVALVREIKRSSSAPTSAGSLVGEISLRIRPEATPIVGRSGEKHEIGTLLEAAAAGAGGGMLISGEGGIGKSKLADWALEEWAARGGVAGKGRCIEFNEPIPYQPILDALNSLIDDRDLAEFLGRVGNGASGRVLQVSIVGLMAEAGAADSSWPAGQLRLFSWLGNELEEATRVRPLLVIVEDLQWADAGTVDFLTYLLERAKSMPLAVLVTTRPAGTAHHRTMIERLSRHCTTVLRIHPLTKMETTRLVCALLDSPRVSSDLAEWIYSESEGNPLFVVETLRLLHQQGNLAGATAGDGRGASALRPAGLSGVIPDGVRSAVQQRLALIDAVSLRVAEIASILGRSFDEEILAMVAGPRRNRLSRAIDRLLRVGIFERENAGYRFAHDKIRAVCYENLPTQVRRTYHGRAAAALAQIPEIPVHQIAWHQLSACQWSLAAESWERAGDHAAQIHAYDEALKAYRHSISCARRDSTLDGEAKDHAEIRLLLKCDEVLAVVGRPLERRDVLARVGTLCQRPSRPSFQAKWLSRRALLEEHVGNFGLAARLARKAWHVAVGHGEKEVEAEALRILAWALNRVGRHRRSLLVSAVALRKMSGLRSPSMVTALWQAAVACVKMSDYLSASSFIERAKAALVALGHAGEVPELLGVEAIVDKWTGRTEKSRASLLEGLRFAKEARDPILAGRITFHLAALDALQGRLGDAIRRLRRGIVASRSAGYIRTHIGCLNEVANGVGRLIGNYPWSWAASVHALRLAKVSDNKFLSTMCEDTQVTLLIEEGRLNEAMATVHEVLQLLEIEQYSAGQYLESLAKRGVIWLYNGDLRRAIADLEEARRAQLQLGDRLLLVDTLTYLALAHAKAGHLERALSTSEEAVRLLTEMNYANMQPQRIFWHHFLILEMVGRESRLPYLQRAVEFIDAQASTLSSAQQRRFRRDVPLNREILAMWERNQQESPIFCGDAPSLPTPSSSRMPRAEPHRQTERSGDPPVPAV